MPQKSQKFISLAELSKEFGYTRDHLAFLCRSGEVSAEKVGRSWVTTREAVKQYQKSMEQVQKQRWDEMSVRQSLHEKSQVPSSKFQTNPKHKIQITNSKRQSRSARHDNLSLSKIVDTAGRVAYLPVEL